MRFGQKKKRKKRPLPRLLILLLLVCGALYLTTPYRISAEGAARAAMPVGMTQVLSSDFPGGRALLVRRGDAGYELVMVRRWGPLWHPVSAVTLWAPFDAHPISSGLATAPAGDKGEMAVAVGGLIVRPEVARVVVTESGSTSAPPGAQAVPASTQANPAAVHTADVQGKQAYLLIWTANSRKEWPLPAVQALDAAGQVLGEADHR